MTSPSPATTNVAGAVGVAGVERGQDAAAVFECLLTRRSPRVPLYPWGRFGRCAGTYTAKPDATFVNLDMIGYVPADQPSRYPAELLHFFADIEREWVSLGGMPHNGKMYGFYDSGCPAGVVFAAVQSKVSRSSSEATHRPDCRIQPAPGPLVTAWLAMAAPFGTGPLMAAVTPRSRPQPLRRQPPRCDRPGNEIWYDFFSWMTLFRANLRPASSAVSGPG